MEGSVWWPTTAIHKYILYYCILYLSTQTYSLDVRVYTRTANEYVCVLRYRMQLYNIYLCIAVVGHRRSDYHTKGEFKLSKPLLSLFSYIARTWYHWVTANKIIFDFIWKGKNNVKRSALISDIEVRGLNTPHLNSIIGTQRVLCCKKLANDQPSVWKTILLHQLPETPWG